MNPNFLVGVWQPWKENERDSVNEPVGVCSSMKGRDESGCSFEKEWVQERVKKTVADDKNQGAELAWNLMCTLQCSLMPKCILNSCFNGPNCNVMRTGNA
ncbi:transketolase chloroplast precursor [Corchorus olitorius]|uniref:Transketolase chloroplast n=1 Tax=Corchorus olitorius TaxID=93759 RepID=A0A1R3KW98_9ROSI|nr:transketolase chloroplast precursor [Corchorus olitorius]